MATTEVKVPDIGDFTGVEVIEVHVKPGDRLAAEDPMITLESDKASMEVPAPAAGEVKEIRVKTGDRVSEGDPILVLETEAAEPAAKETKPGPPAPARPKQAAAPAPSKPGQGDIEAELLVLGSGPGGYTAAFRAADLGLKTVLVERYPTLGGVCLNVGCIPSKALLHAAKVIAEAREMAEHGLTFGKPEIDLDKLADWKDGVVGRLTGGLAGLAKQRKVQVVQGTGKFTSPNQLEVATENGKTTIGFAQAIIAAGSAPVFLPFIPRDDPRVMDSTGALDLDDIPERLLVLGGGIIGLEMATVYHELGSKITVVELMDQLIPGVDPDIIRPLQKRIEGLYENIFLGTKATAIKPDKQGLEVSFEGPKAPKSDVFEKIL
ncbi:MAG TPA: FAD-dependent oxidoreductase, partial [Geminicoccaceae bacterium]|nr:FAD-dependent oxidoreductase [Geminicoccaceae bacterium]